MGRAGSAGAVAVYAEKGGRVRVEVRLEGEMVWLTLAQMADLFGRDKSVISKHLRNVYLSRELVRRATVAKNATVQIEGGREVMRQVEYYNLDAILSVGYRVNSVRGTRFRIWATETLRQHLLRGFTVHERRLRETGLAEIEQTVGLLARTLKGHDLVTDEGRAVLEVVEQYTRSWRLLVAYDERRLAEAPTQPRRPDVPLELAYAREAIATLRRSQPTTGRTAGLFGHERDQQLAAILGNVEQTFGGRSALSERPGTGGAPAVLPDQGPPLLRRQQAHRVAPVSRVPAPERHAAAGRRSAAPRRHHHGGARSPRRRERSGAEGTDDPPRGQPARGSIASQQTVTKVFIGGSRRITRIPMEVRRRIDRIVEQGWAPAVLR